MQRYLTLLVLNGLFMAVIVEAKDNLGFSSKVTVVSPHKWSVERLAHHLAGEAGFAIGDSGAVLRSVDGGETQFPAFGYFDECEVRYSLSWVVHMAGVSATISNKTITVSRPVQGKSPILPPELSLWRITEGNWVEEASCQLDKVIPVRKSARMSAYLAVEFFCRQAGIRVLVISDAGKRDLMRQEINVKAQSLRSLLEEQRIPWQLQGGGIVVGTDLIVSQSNRR